MKKMFIKKITIILCAVMLIGCLLANVPERVEAAPQQDAKLGALKVVGSQLCDKNGNAVQLKGVSTHGLSWFPEYVNDECFGELHDKWGVNVVRLAMYTEEYNGYCSGDEANKKKLRELVLKGVEYAKNHDLYVIVDWHILSDGNPMTNVSEAKKFWETMAQSLSSYDNVLYEICNEPNGAGSWSEIKNYANQVIPIIRKYDSDSVIIVGTPTWSQEVDKPAADPLSYDNVLYTLHFYAATHKQYLRDTAEAAIKKGLPIFVSEFGICDASGNGELDTEEAQKWLSLLDKYQISYVAWNLSNKAESSSLISSSCNKKSGFTKADLSRSGQWYFEKLAGGNAKSETAKLKKATIKIKTTNFKVSRKHLKKAKRFNPGISVNSKGKLTFKKLAGSKYLSVNKNGRIRVRAKTPKGKYSIKIKVNSARTKAYKAASKKYTIKIRVR